MFSRFFIDRPIGASMISVAIVLLGVFLYWQLPVASYPDIAPPTIQVSTAYPGANAQVVAQTVAAPIEQEVNGVENMLYMSSKSTNDGQMNLDVVFELGTNLDMAQVLVQNRVAIAQAKLPEEVRRQGVTTKKRSPSILLIVNLYSPDHSRSMLYLNNYVILRIKDVLARIKGVGDAQVLGARDYSMRVWLDPQKLSEKDLMAGDVIQAIQGQNVQVAAGRLGQPPTPPGQVFQLTINTQGRLLTPEQFAEIIVKTGEDGRLVYLRDVVRDDLTKIHLDRDLLKKEDLKVSDIVQVLRDQDIQFPPQRPGLPPAVPTDQDLEFTVRAGRALLENLVVKGANSDDPTLLSELVKKQGGLVELNQGVELGAKSYEVSTYLDGDPSVGLAIYQQPGANAVKTAKAVRAEMKKLAEKFTPGVDYKIVYDTTVFIDESIKGVQETLIEALILVFLVVLLFLQNWRTTVIPLVAVPVSLIGTFAVMAALGFSLNNLSLFGLVLAIGVTVDDAIVVVENVERNMAQGLNARDASVKAMNEITGAVIATTLVLCAVFIPTALIAGITGQFYRQFALTIAAATVISTFNALTLSPALCALLLRPRSEGVQQPLPRIGIVILVGLVGLFLAPRLGSSLGLADGWLVRAAGFVLGAVLGWLVSRALNWLLGTFFAGFNWVFDRARTVYGHAVQVCLRLSVIVLLVYGGLLGLTYLGFNIVPKGFIPPQDKGYLLLNAQLPEGASLDRTEKVVAEMNRIAMDVPGVAHTIGVPGYSLLVSTNISNVGGMFVILDSFDRRQGNDELSADAILAKLRRRLYGVMEAQIVAFGAPPVDGVGSTGGFKLQVQDRGNVGLGILQGTVARMVAKGNEQKELQGLFSSFRVDQPQIYLGIDRVQAKRLGVKLGDLYATLQANLGSAYVNDFTFEGRNWQVNVQADARYRMQRKDIGQLEVRNAEGKMVPLSTLIEIKEVTGPALVNRYNLYPAAEITGNPAPGYSSGQAMAFMDEIAKQELPQSMGYEWTELSLQEKKAAADQLSKLVFPLGVAFMFMVLAFQYESLSLPLAIMLIVPLCLLCAVLGVGLCAMDINIFTQIGFVVLAALAAKNAILIVEFAKERQDAGLSRFDATLEAARLRLRPILMTAFSTLLGSVPLVIAVGAGAEMRVALGIAFFSGMLGVSLFGLFFTPVFYLVIRWFVERGRTPAPATPAPAPAVATSSDFSQPALASGQPPPPSTAFTSNPSEESE